MENACVQEHTVHYFTLVYKAPPTRFFGMSTLNLSQIMTLFAKNLLQLGAFVKVLQRLKQFGGNFYQFSYVGVLIHPLYNAFHIQQQLY